MAYALHQDGKRIAAFEDAEQLVRYLLHNPQILKPAFVILPATPKVNHGPQAQET